MSLGGGEASTAVIVYGPDGKAYGSPAQARAAGVENATMSPPPGAPASAPGAYSAPTLDFSTPNIVYAPPMAGPAPYNPMGEASLGVIVYGPDGRAYGSPAQARNAGVSNPTMSPPADVPISYPGRQPYTPAPLPSIPTQSSGGRNRYAEIMSQFGQSQPFSFFGMPSGGFNPYASDYTGGFTPYTPQPAAPVTRYEEIMAQTERMGGGGGRGMQEAPSAFSQMTPAERAAYYAENPTEGKIALGMQDLFGNATLLGNVAKYFGADGWYDSRLEKQGYDPKQFAYGPPDLRGGTTPDGLGSPTLSGGFVQAPGEAGRGGSAPVAPAQTGGFTPYSGTLNAIRYYDGMGREISKQQAEQGGSGAVVSNLRSAEEAQARADSAAQDARIAAFDASRESGRGGGGGGGGMGGDGGGGYGGGGDGAAGRGEPGGDRGGWGRGGGYAKGGYVSRQHLGGPDPKGPDDGYAALKDGEFVINDKAVKKYGIELMNAINSGKISKGKLRGLLEM